ncbi:hypothetical protein ACFXJ8_08455 [Nonomuraea sp. NPDC059194]
MTPAVEAAVGSVEGEVVPLNRYTKDRAYRSEQLDLDHLSPPKPM